MIGQPLTHAAPPGLTDNSNTRWRLSSQPEENPETPDYFPESKTPEGNSEIYPEFSIPDPDVESRTSRTKRNSNKKDKRKSSEKKSSLEYKGIDACKPCPGTYGNKITNTKIDPFAESEEEAFRRLQGMVGLAQKDTKDVLDGYTENGRVQTHAYEAIARKITFPNPVKPPGKKNAKRLLRNKKKLAKLMQKHYKSLSAAYHHMHFIQEDEKSFKDNFGRLDTLLDDNKELLGSMNTLLCQLYAKDWTPDKCASPPIESIRKLYEKCLDNNAEIWDKDLVVLRYNEKALDNLQNTLNSLLDASRSPTKKRRGNKRGRGRGKGKGKGRKNRKNGNKRSKKNKARNE